MPGHILDKSPLPPIASNNEDNLRPMTALAPKTQLPRIDHPKPPLPLETIPSSSSPIQQEKVLNLDESSASTLLGIVIFRPFFPSRSLRFISCMCNNRYLSLFTIRPFCARWTIFNIIKLIHNEKSWKLFDAVRFFAKLKIS